MTYSAGPESFEIGDYLGVLRRRGWIVIVLACVGVLAAAGYVKLGHKTYTATALVFVSPNAANASQASGSRTAGVTINMDNEAQVVQSETVAASAARMLGTGTSPTDLLKQVSVTIPANTTDMQISCSAASATQSAACAQAFANAYLNSRKTTAANEIAAKVSVLEGRELALLKRSVALRASLKRLPRRSSKRTIAKAQLRTTSAGLAVLRADISALGASDNDYPGYIGTPATPPTSPSSPAPLLDLPSGLLAGLLIGLLLAFILDRRDDRIHAARDVARFVDVPVLLDLTRQRISLADPLVAPRSAAGRAFGAMAQAVTHALGGENRVIVVADSTRGNCGSVVAMNLAATLARTHGEVILVGTDPDDTFIPRQLGIGKTRGLAELLAGSAKLSHVARRPAGIAGLRVIAAGFDGDSLVCHLQHDPSRHLIGELRAVAKYVVIAVSVSGDGSDAFGLAEFADAAIVAVEIRGSRRSEVSDLVLRLDRLRTDVAGAAVLPPLRQAAAWPRSRLAGSTRAVSSARPGWADPPQPVQPPEPALPPQAARRRSAELAEPAPRSAQASEQWADPEPAPRGPAETRPLPKVTEGTSRQSVRYQRRLLTDDGADQPAGGPERGD